jgi:HSP20 family protein
MAERGTEIAVREDRVDRMPRSLNPLGEVESLFEDFFGRSWPRLLGRSRPMGELGPLSPSVDIVDRDEEVFVRVEVPGFKKDEIEVSVSGNLLTLSGEARSEEKEEKGSYYRSEITRGAFTRTLQLPAEVDDSQARASMKDGVLELTLPKVENSKRRTIAIS